MTNDRYDVLVSDIGVPDLDGVSLIKETPRHFHETTGDLPAVALTAFAMEADRPVALAAGFDDDIAKPISLGALARAVSRVADRAVHQSA